MSTFYRQWLLGSASMAVLCLRVAAAPFGTLVCAMGTPTDYRITTLDAADGAQQVLATGATVFAGLDGAPCYGDPCVVGRLGAGGGINWLGGDGALRALVPQAARGANIDPCISFDQAYVAYVQRNASPSNEDILHVITVATGADTPVYTTKLWGVDLAHPRFAPDSSRLIFALDDAFWGSRDIYAMPVAGGIPQELEDLPENAMHPCYAPNGRLLACVAPYGGSFAAYIANADGSNPRRIDLGGEFALFPCFSPCSRYLAVASDNGINIMDVSSGAVLTQLPLDYDGYYGLAWHLDAQQCAASTLKVSVKSTAIKATVAEFAPPPLPGFGALWLDGVFTAFDNPALWLDKNGKKYVYRDKALKYKCTYTLKKQSVAAAVKNLALAAGTDYRTGVPVRVTVNLGARTCSEVITLDARGAYKRPR